MRIIIAGGRDFRDYKFLEKEIDAIIKKLDLHDLDIHFITGGCRGADKLGLIYA